MRLIKYRDILLLRCAKYVPYNKDQQAKHDFVLYTEFLLSTLGQLFEEFIAGLEPYERYLKDMYDKEPDMLNTGFLFFLFALVYCRLHDIHDAHTEDFFVYTLLYMLGDNYMDNYDVDVDELKRIINCCYVPASPSCDGKDNNKSILVEISRLCNKLYVRYPGIDVLMKNLLYEQIKSTKIQKHSDLDLDIYLQNARNKGNCVARVYHHMFSFPYQDDVGYVMQLIDDTLDMHLDREHGITTYCSKMYDMHHNLDNIIDTSLEIVLNMKDPVYKVILLSILFAVPQLHPEYFSEELVEDCRPLSVFPKKYDIRKVITEKLLLYKKQ